MLSLLFLFEPSISEYRTIDQKTSVRMQKIFNTSQVNAIKPYRIISIYFVVSSGVNFLRLRLRQFFFIFEVTIVLASFIFLGSQTYGYGLFDRPVSSDSQLSLIIGYLFVCHDHIWSKVRYVTKSSNEGQSLDHIWSESA